MTIPAGDRARRQIRDLIDNALEGCEVAALRETRALAPPAALALIKWLQRRADLAERAPRLATQAHDKLLNLQVRYMRIRHYEGDEGDDDQDQAVAS